MNRAIGRKLILICGLPGAGKTTLAKRLEEELGAVRLAPDEWMAALSIDVYDEPMRAKIEALQWKFGKQLLALGLTVIVEWGTWARSERDDLRLQARTVGASVDLYYLSAPVGALFERIQRRATEDPAIERSALQRWSEIFEAPTAEEMALFDTAWRSTDLEYQLGPGGTAG